VGTSRRTHMIDTGDIGAFLGLDVGKGRHHASRPPRREEGVRQAAVQQPSQKPYIPSLENDG
jgi:hypothetical protein